MSIIHLNDGNFRKEVLESDLPVLVDFWAQWCIDPQTSVSVDERDNYLAYRIKKGCYALSYNGSNINRYKIIDSRVSKVLGHCKKIVTYTGREIKVTDDHRFYTPKGWKKAEDLDIGDKVAIYPSVDIVNYKRPRKILVSEEDVLKYAFKTMNTNMYIRELKSKGLLPLRFDNPGLLILARLIGAQFSDGSLCNLDYNNYREISFSLGQIKDIKEVSQDLNELGFDCSCKKKVSNCNIEGRPFVMHSYVARCHSTALWLLLQALGAPSGNKTNTPYQIPDWLMKSNSDLKREFLAAYLGGDGPALNFGLQKRKDKEPCNQLSINDIEFHKRSDLEKTGLMLGLQISKLLSEFGVKVNRVFAEDDSYKRKDNSRVKIIHIRFSTNFESGYNLCYKIGYAYSAQKSLKSKFVSEFLRKRLFERNLCSQKYREAVLLFKKGKMDISQIALKLGLSSGTVFGWVRYNKKPTILKHFEKYPAWLRESRRGLKDGLLWERINRVESIYLDKVQSLSVEKTHNFIANDFLVHNCGPCKMIAPTVEELAKEYDGKIKVGKVDVDECNKTASDYGIMSIPTLVFFKGGKIMHQAAGALSKAELKRKIQENLL